MTRRELRRRRRAARRVVRANLDEQLAAIRLDQARWATRVAELEFDTLVREFDLHKLRARIERPTP